MASEPDIPPRPSIEGKWLEPSSRKPRLRWLPHGGMLAKHAAAEAPMPIKPGAYLIEFHRMGLYVKTSAIDPETNTEVSIVGDARASDADLSRMAVRKLEFVLKDAIGREWQCGTWQVDLNLPARLGAQYVDEHSQKRTPVMLHRAIFGSLERFLGILLEHHAGKLPAWLAPVQAVVLNISEKQANYATEAADFLKNQGLRAEIDLRNEKVGYKIRDHTLKRVPYLLVAGDREVESRSLAVRTRSGKDLGAMPLQEVATRIAQDVAGRGRRYLED